jgi:hypothetical protein
MRGAKTRNLLVGLGGAALSLSLLAAAQSPSLPGRVKSRMEQGGAGTAEKVEAGKPAPEPAAPSKPTAGQRRDPFRSLLMRAGDLAGGMPLPPGKRGLVVAQLSVNGIVATPTERIAVVNMAGRNRAYFLRERDELFDGYVARISEDGVIFRERTKDAFGREYEREVVKQLVAGTTRSGARR